MWWQPWLPSHPLASCFPCPGYVTSSIIPKGILVIRLPSRHEVGLGRAHFWCFSFLVVASNKMQCICHPRICIKVRYMGNKPWFFPVLARWVMRTSPGRPRSIVLSFKNMSVIINSCFVTVTATSSNSLYPFVIWSILFIYSIMYGNTVSPQFNGLMGERVSINAGSKCI